MISALGLRFGLVHGLFSVFLRHFPLFVFWFFCFLCSFLLFSPSFCFVLLCVQIDMQIFEFALKCSASVLFSSDRGCIYRSCCRGFCCKRTLISPKVLATAAPSPPASSTDVAGDLETGLVH